MTLPEAESSGDTPVPFDAAQARRHALRYDAGELPSDDDALDAALGMECSVREAIGVEGADAGAHHPGESVAHLATPYATCRAFFHTVRPGPRDHVVDLGCGFGRFVVYGALTTPATVRGIELLPSRARIAERWVRRLGLVNAEIVTGNVLAHSFERATIFYAFRPFSVETEGEVLRRLHAAGRSRAITIGALRLMPGLFDERVFSCQDYGDMRILRSRAE